MKKYFKIGFLILLGALLVLQFFRPKKNIDKGPQPNAIAQLLPMPDSVTSILKTACYDCHSNNTVYPWYAEIMPLGWFINNHVVEGKRELNFDLFGTYTPKRALKKLEEVTHEIEEGAMPLSSYTKIHRNAVLSATQKKLVIDWANSSIDSLKRKFKDTLK